MHGRMDSDDEESDGGEEVAAAVEPDADFDIADDIPFKLGSDDVEVDPENDPIRAVPIRVPDSNRASVPASAAVPAKKNVKSLTLAERLLLDKKVNDGQRVEVRLHCFFFISYYYYYYYY